MNSKNSRERLRSIVVYPNERTTNHGDILAIARAEAQKRERTSKICIKTIKFVPELGVYVALYPVFKPSGVRRK